MPNRDIIVLGSSAGGVHALQEVMAGLPADLPAALFVVQHISPYGMSAMPAILSRAGALPAVHPRDGQRIEPGHVYVAPPDHHIVIERGRIRVSRGPNENGHRPAVDVLFRTAANVYGPRVIGVVLTGNLDDGTAGLAAIKSLGGVAVVQEPSEADYPGMPASAIENVTVDHVLGLQQIPDLLVRLAQETVEEASKGNGQEETADMKKKLERGEDREEGGVPSGFTCPDCGGALWESHENSLVHFRCRTGHAFAPESLLAGQVETLEVTLWAAVRALEENASLARRMEKWMRNRGHEAGRVRYAHRAESAERHAEALKRVLMEDREEIAAAPDGEERASSPLARV